MTLFSPSSNRQSRHSIGGSEDGPSKYLNAASNSAGVAWMGDAKCAVNTRSKLPISGIDLTHSRTSSGARASANARRMGARTSRPRTASYPGQRSGAPIGASASSRKGRKTACSTVFGQKDGSASVSAPKYEPKMGGGASGTNTTESVVMSVRESRCKKAVSDTGPAFSSRSTYRVRKSSSSAQGGRGDEAVGPPTGKTPSTR
mmetsp:Transcript_37643/g.120946  ORF Transcript_37643/g.120946 Transcript_37643/m.120946 type:complete len:203 (+) Transcript_37643:96-704(+)